MTVAQLIEKLTKFQAKHGGDALILKEDPLGNVHFVGVDFGMDAFVAPCTNRADHFDMSDEKNAQPVFVIS